MADLILNTKVLDENNKLLLDALSDGAEKTFRLSICLDLGRGVEEIEFTYPTPKDKADEKYVSAITARLLSVLAMLTQKAKATNALNAAKDALKASAVVVPDDIVT